MKHYMKLGQTYEEWAADNDPLADEEFDAELFNYWQERSARAAKLKAAEALTAIEGPKPWAEGPSPLQCDELLGTDHYFSAL